MANQDLIQQLVTSIASNPNLLSSFVEHPYSTTSQVTGQQEVSREDVSQAVTAVSLLGSGQQLDFGGLAQLAAQLLSQNGGSAHTMAQSLLSEQSTATPSQNDILTNLANVTFGQGIAGIDLSDGFGVDDMMAIASKIFGFGK